MKELNVTAATVLYCDIDLIGPSSVLPALTQRAILMKGMH